MIENSLPIEGPLDLRATLRPLHGAFRSDGWWYAARTNDGAATLQVARTGERLLGRAWGPGAESLLARLGGFAGLDDDPATFQPSHPIVAELHRRNPGARFGRNGQVFAELVMAVASQKVTGAEAHRAMRGLSGAFSDPAPGPRPDLMLPPDAGRMADAPYWDYHPLHIEKKRAEVLRRVAASHELIDALADDPPEEASRVLSRFPGVGPWTIAETLAPSHGDADAIPVGDFHLKNIVVYHLTGKPRGTDEEMVALLEEFRPHRGRVARLLHQLGHAPKFGPRTTPRDITRY